MSHPAASLDHIRRSVPQIRDELGVAPVSVHAIRDPAIYALEKERLFKKVWLKVATAWELPNPGDYKVKEMPVADTSVLIVRGKDGRIRAFHNVCTHRGNKVVPNSDFESFGRARANVLSCRFHGWVYDAEGTLKQVPSEQRFYGCFSKADNGLAPIHLDTWEGFLFVSLAETPENSLAEFLGDYATHFAGYPFDALDYGFTYHTYLDCNWKVAHDAFAEAYHVDTIHAGSFPNVFSTGLQNVKLMGPHRTCAVCLTLNAKPTPVAAIANAMAGASLVSTRAESMLPPTINPDKRADFAFELSVLFPNTLIHVAEGIWFTHQFWPIAHNKTLWEGRYYVKAPQTNGQRWATEHAMTLQRNAWLEDTATMEDTQRAMQSRAKTLQHLQDDEILIRHGAVIVDRFVNA